MNGYWLTFAIVLASSCGARVAPEATDTNTNWLAACEEPSECDNGLECLCGHCTVRCARSQECTEHDDQAMCLPTNSCDEETAVCGTPDSASDNPTDETTSVCPLPIERYTSLGECASVPNCEGATFFTDACGCGCTPTTECAWGVNEVLNQAGIENNARLQCGTINSIDVSAVGEGFECIVNASNETGAEFTINDCIDCAIPSTYVRVPSGELYRVLMEDDLFGGDTNRTIALERCAEFDMDAAGRCAGSVLLYQCSEPRPPM